MLTLTLTSNANPPFFQVPDAYLLSDTTFELMHGKRNVYREKGVNVARSTSIGEGVVLGRGTRLGEHSSISRTIIGRDCRIGTNSRIVESHIWAGAVVESDVHVLQSVICEGVVIKRGARIGKGCVLSNGVVVGEDVNLPDFTSVSLHQRSQEEMDDVFGGSSDSDGEDWIGGEGLVAAKPSVDKNAPYHFSALGADGKGKTSSIMTEHMVRFYHTMECLAHYAQRHIHITSCIYLLISAVGYIWSPMKKTASTDGASVISQSDNEDTSVEDEDDETGMTKPFDERISHSMGCTEEEKKRRQLWRVIPEPYDTDDSEDEYSLDEDEEAEMKNFIRNVGEMIVTGRAECHSADNLLMEIKGLKFAQNKTFADCLRGMTPELILVPLRDMIRTRDECKITPMTIMKKLQPLLSPGSDGWAHNMLKPMIHEEHDERAVIEAVESVCIDPTHKLYYYSIYRMILQVMFDAELVSEEALLDFFEERTDGMGSEGDNQPRDKLLQEATTQEFIEWLKEEDDSEEESSGEESD